MKISPLIRQLSGTMLVLLATLSAVNAQPCGAEARIQLIGGTASVFYYADSSGYQPGWVAYNYEWYVNDAPPVNGPTFLTGNTEWLPAGFNRVCLKVYSTNSGTGDSCIDEYCNIYQSTGTAIFPEFDVSVNGLTVTFTGSYFGGPGMSPSQIYYDFGDGTQSTGNSLFETHTYSNPGTKSVYLYVVIPSPSGGPDSYGQVGRVVNVGAGAVNTEINNVFDNTFCDSVSLNVSSSPAFTGCSVYRNYMVPSSPPVNGTYSTINVASVPGHDFFVIDAYTVTAGSDAKPYLIKFSDCNIAPDTVYGTVFNDLNGNGLREAGEPGLIKSITVTSNPGVSGYSSSAASYSTVSDSAGNYSILVPNHPVRISLTSTSGYTITYPQYSYQDTKDTNVTSFSNFNFGLSPFSTRICGKTYLDDNMDSLYSSSADRTLPNVYLVAENSGNGFLYREVSDASGNYCFDLPPGTFTVRPVYTNLDSASFVPDSIEVAAPAGGTFNNRNFGFRSPVPVNFDLKLSAALEARPGFNYSLTSRVYNRGYLKGKGVVVINFDSLLTYLNSTPSGATVDPVNHTITWTTDSVPTGAGRFYTANFNIPASTPLGTQLQSSSAITATPGIIENELSNNSDSRTQTVIGSFDPNDKAVTPAGIGSAGDVLHNTRFEYRIRFQNTGTASAINVFVLDTISENLDLNTLFVERASHAYNLVISGNVLTWRFFNINLPDSNTNEPASHGFIEYSISPRAGLSDGTTIENTAYIYFDFNEPVVTNTTLNTMQSSLAGVAEEPAKQKLMVYPNPGKDRFFVFPRTEIFGPVVLSLYDLTGSKIRTLFTGTYPTGSTLKADAGNLPSGVYILELRHANGVERVRWICQ